ncbi:MAG: HD domain-containing protein [Planctomycetes bacterium]|nr:HD domain-containing protein [Planctomycetota bacterium]
MSAAISDVTDAAPDADTVRGVDAQSAPDQVRTEAVPVQSLITNRPIKFPIYDTGGLLLLAEGSLITTKFKELLRARGVAEVLLHEEDVQSVTLAGHAISSKSPHPGFDTELTAKLDQIIESGNLFVANSGEALVNQMISRGCRGYDREERDRVVDVHRDASAALDECIQDALRGKSVDCKQLMDTTGQYLTAMMSDADCVLSVVMEVGDDTILADHCLQMSMLGMAIGIEMGLDDENSRTLGLCGLLHDWGMVRVPESIRNATHILSDGDFVAIKKHPIHALEMLEKITGIPSTVPLAAYQVHERPNGTGYPRARRQHETHVFARILGVADAYLALTTARPYRHALMPYAAMECLITQASQNCFDPKIVKSLIQIMALFPIGSYVVLNDGSVARVLRRSGKEYGRPIVQLLKRQDGSELAEDDESAIVNLAETTSLHVVQALPTPGATQIALSPEIVKINRDPIVTV